MPSPLIPTCSMVDMVDMVWATMVVLDTMAMDWDTMARGPLMLMPSPLLILTSMVATMVAMDMAVDTTGDKSSHLGDLDIHQDLSVNHQLLCQQKNGLFQFEFHPPPVLPVSVLPA